ncbi:MAG: flagellar hook capping FlgD N-terminal domain-containing protein [Candidatus Korobacteraceae bacterium]|jgi:flagellar basal-body rod modification protein FlgD
MYITPTRMDATTPTTPTAQTTASSSTNTLSDTQSMFLTLLTTELKTQDPTAPEDPTQMVDQLVQFNSLNQLININGSMSTLVSDATPATTSGSQTTPTGAN